MMRKTGYSLRLLFGAGVLLVLLGSPGCSNSEDYSSAPKAKATKDDIQKVEFERDQAAKAARSGKKVH